MSVATATAAAADPDSRGPRGSHGPPPPRPMGPGGPPGAPGTAPRAPFMVDREKTCPLLLRVFPKLGAHHRLEEYAVRGREPSGEVQIYTWKDATLRELSDLIKEVSPVARRRDTRISFAFVYPNRQGRNVMKQAGVTFAVPGRSMDENRTLQELGFQTGDFLDVAILG